MSTQLGIWEDFVTETVCSLREIGTQMNGNSWKSELRTSWLYVSSPDFLWVIVLLLNGYCDWSSAGPESQCVWWGSLTYLLNRWKEAFPIVFLEWLTSVGAQILYLLIITIINDFYEFIFNKITQFYSKDWIYLCVLTACVYVHQVHEVPMKARRGCPIL